MPHSGGIMRQGVHLSDVTHFWEDSQSGNSTDACEVSVDYRGTTPQHHLCAWPCAKHACLDTFEVDFISQLIIQSFKNIMHVAACLSMQIVSAGLEPAFRTPAAAKAWTSAYDSASQ